MSAILLFSCVNLFAQDVAGDVSSEATSVLLERTKDLLEENDPESLLPYLREILIRVSGEDDKEALQARSFCMYQIGVCQMQVKEYADAIESLDLFLDKFPRDPNAASASMLLAEAYAMKKDWVGAEEYARTLIDEKSIPETRRMSAVQLLGEALFGQKKWSEAVDPLQTYFKWAKDPKDRSTAALMLVTCFVKEKDYANFLKFLDFCDDSVRQHTALNMALIEAGDQKYREGDFANALVMYRAVLRHKERVELFKKQIAEIETFLATPYKVTVGSSRSRYEKERNRKRAELDRKKKQLVKAKTGKNYDVDLMLRTGQTYAGMKRYIPAYTSFRRLYTEAPNHELAQDALYRAFNALLDLKKYEQAVVEGAAYLKRYPNGKYAAEVSLNQMQAYLQMDQTDKAQQAGLNALKLLPEHPYMDQVKYLLGYTYFQQMEYADAFVAFKEVFEKWPDGRYREPAEYWTAMSYLFLGRFAEAVDAFEAYLRNTDYEVRRFAEDASYRLGIALYGAQRYDESEQVFRRFIDTYPDSDLESEAYSMIGDLLGAKGDLDKAIEEYKKALDCAVSMAQTDYATFQSAKVYELDGQFRKVIELMEQYLSDYGEKGNYAGAGFWIGKAYKALGQDGKALATYLENVVEYGDKLDNNDVDLILLELVKESKESESVSYSRSLHSRLMSEIRRAGAESRQTLLLRLETLASFITDGEERKGHINEIFKIGNLDNAGPMTLLLMAEESQAENDTKTVHKVYKHCMDHYEDSEVLPDIMNIEMQTLFNEGKYKEVLDLGEDISFRFGYSKEVGLARKLMGDAYRLRGQYQDAIKIYKELFAVRAWRGPLTPQALYWIGVCENEQGNTKEALAYFKRVSVMYETYTEWMAKAYEASFECFEKLGETEQIILGCQAMLANEAAAATPEGIRARARLENLLRERGIK